MKAKSTLLLFAALIIGCLSASAAETAESILTKAANDFHRSPSITASYRLTSGGETATGNIVMSKERFHITSAEMLVWYDGKTQWTLNRASDEVDVTEPTPEELQTINAFAIISSFRNSYDAKILSTSANATRLLLKAKSPKARISSATLTLNANYMPTSIDLTLNDNRKASISISSLKTGDKLPADDFRFDKAKYPGVYVNDLR